MADEKKKLTGEQLKTDSERAKKLDDAKNAPDSEKLSEDELNAVAGGYVTCTPAPVDDDEECSIDKYL